MLNLLGDEVEGMSTRKPPRPPLRRMLGFHGHAGAFTAFPQREFAPRGLIIWGAVAGDIVRACIVANNEQVSVSYPGVPARFFGLAENFEAVERMLAEGKEPPGWGTWDVCRVGCQIRIEVSNERGPRVDERIEVAMWGEVPDLC